MTPSFATSLDALGGWRAALGERLEALARFLGEHDLPDGAAADAARRAARAPRQREARRRLRRRVLARQVRADQRDLLRRHRPPHPAGDAGPHDDVPGRARLATATSRPSLAAAADRDAARRPLARRDARAAARLAPPRARRRRRRQARASRCTRSRGPSGSTEDQARALGFWDDDDARRQPAARRRRARSRCRPGAMR